MRTDQNLGVWIGKTESEQAWSEAFSELKDRGLEGVVYVVSDAHKGLRDSVARYFHDALWQRCQVHFKRNMIGKVGSRDKERVASFLKDITDAPTLAEARSNLQAAIEKLSEEYEDVAEPLEEDGEQMLTVYALPEKHRRRMRSTNMIERWFRDIRSRTKVVKIFPNRASLMRLVCAHCMEANEVWLERRCLRMDSEKIEVSIAEMAQAERPPSELEV